MLLFFLWSMGRAHLCLQPWKSVSLLPPQREGWGAGSPSVLTLSDFPLMLVQNWMGREPTPNSLHPRPPRGQTVDVNPVQGCLGILAMGAASWRVTVTFLGAGGLGLSGAAVVGRVDIELLPLLQFPVSYSNGVYVQLTLWFCASLLHNQGSAVLRCQALLQHLAFCQWSCPNPTTSL